MGSSSSTEKLSNENKLKIKSELKVLLKKKLKNKSSELSKKKSDKKKVSDFKETAKKILIKKPVTKTKKLSVKSSKKIGEFRSLIKTAVVKGKKKIGSSKISPKKKASDFQKTAKKILIKKPVAVIKKLAKEGSKKISELGSFIKSSVVKGKKKAVSKKSSKVVKGGYDYNLMN